jgi:ABC-type transport system substrate-binding protein
MSVRARPRLPRTRLPAPPLVALLVPLLVPLLLAALACQVVAPLPTAVPTATPTAPPAVTPAPTRTRAPTRTPTPRVTATRVPSPTPRPRTPTREPGVFSSDLLGVTLRYPPRWLAREDAGNGIALMLIDQANGVLVLLLQGPLTHGASPAEIAEQVLEQIVQGSGEVLSSEAITLDDGTPAHASVISVVTDEGEVTAKLVVAARGERSFVVMAMAEPELYDEQVETIDDVLYSLELREPRPYGISRDNALVLAGAEPETLDPAVQLGSPADFVGLIFSGLVALDTRLQVVPDLADRWELSADGRTYTFFLRREVTFHDGRPFTAADVRYSLERAADPATGSNTAATYLGDIVGVRERLAGEAETLSGVQVLDDYTVAITIDAPKAYFLAKLAYPTSWIVDRANVESGRDWHERPNGTGPFRLARWEHDEVLIFERNPDYYRADVALEHVLYLLDGGLPLQLYETGDIDMSSVPGDALARVLDPDEPLNADVVSGPAFCTSRIVFDAAQPPFDDPAVRQAFAMAVDRDRLIEALALPNVTRADGVLPPGMPGYGGDIEPLAFDPEGARERLAGSRYAGALPEIIYTVRGQGGQADRVTSAVVEMWQDHLDVRVRIALIDPADYEDAIYGEHGQIVDFSWCADYPDPENFLDVLYHSEQKNNVGHYADPEVDRLLEQARSERDVRARLALYHTVEQQVVRDAAALPLLHFTQYALVRPYVQNFVLTPIGVAQLQFVALEH